MICTLLYRIGNIVDHLLQIKHRPHIILLNFILAAEYEEIVAVRGDPEKNWQNNDQQTDR